MRGVKRIREVAAVLCYDGRETVVSLEQSPLTLMYLTDSGRSSVASRPSDATSVTAKSQQNSAPSVPNNIAVVVRVRPETDGRRCGFTGPNPRGGISADENGQYVWMSPADASGDGPNGASGNGGSRPALALMAGTATARKKFYPEVAMGPAASQEEVYVGAVRRLVAAVASGVNASVLGYGATGSGKTVSVAACHRSC